MTHSTLGIPLRFGLVIAPLFLGCDKLDVGDFDDGTTSGGGSGSPTATSNASTEGGDEAGPGGSTANEATSAGSASEEGGTSDGGTTGGPIGNAVCDPLLQDCAAGDVCAWDFDAFRCLPWDSHAGFGEVCETTNACDAGLQCVDPESVGCAPEEAGCCTPFCDLDDHVSVGCPGDTVCTAWYEAGDAPAGLENLGVCRIGEGGGSESESEGGGSSSESGGPGIPSECDGLAQDCAAGESCVLDDTFACMPEGNQDEGEACVAANDCDVGLICASGDLVLGCADESGRCCTRICHLVVPDCPAGTMCNAVPGGPYIGNESTGYCTL